MHTEVSLLAILIAVLNLSAIGDIVNGIENLQFFNSLQEIIKNQALPYVNKSIALLAISNIYTLSKKVDISEET
jgi:Flp pilus assembly pilin Flp